MQRTRAPSRVIDSSREAATLASNRLRNKAGRQSPESRALGALRAPGRAVDTVLSLDRLAIMAGALVVIDVAVVRAVFRVGGVKGAHASHRGLSMVAKGGGLVGRFGTGSREQSGSGVWTGTLSTATLG